jgi:hypothetical protein
MNFCAKYFVAEKSVARASPQFLCDSKDPEVDISTKAGQYLRPAGAAGLSSLIWATKQPM